jgi:signal transduction histidine kinase
VQIEKPKKWLGIDISYIPLLLGAVVTVAIVYIVYVQTQNLLKERLRERITAIVATASLQIDGDLVATVIKDRMILSKKIQLILDSTTEKFEIENIMQQLKNDQYLQNHPILKLTENMKKIREVNNNLKYIYILELTNTPNVARFITDSDTVIPVDWDVNGKIDEIEYPPLPGEDYDISEIPGVLEAQNGPLAVEELYSDKWGTFLSGYAPIKDSNERLIGILAIDVQVDDFNRVIRATIIPFILLAIVLLSMLLVQTLALVKIWANRVEMVKELDRQKDELLSIVSHQLATPVSSIKWYTEMLIDGDLGKLNKAQLEHLQNTQAIIGNMSDLVSMILDVSRIQLGRMHVEKQMINLNELFSEIEKVILPKTIEKRIKYVSKIQKELPLANLDKRLSRMTIENLLSNAIKYTPTGGNVIFTVTLTNNILRCSVVDTGIGIPKNEQSEIFGKLFRASNARSSIDGNGFGLYIAKGAIEGQGGKIWFESEENKGTSFYIDLPLK